MRFHELVDESRIRSGLMMWLYHGYLLYTIPTIYRLAQEWGGEQLFTEVLWQTPNVHRWRYWSRSRKCCYRKPWEHLRTYVEHIFYHSIKNYDYKRSLTLPKESGGSLLGETWGKGERVRKEGRGWFAKDDLPLWSFSGMATIRARRQFFNRGDPSWTNFGA